jgi:hypothetical protein
MAVDAISGRTTTDEATAIKSLVEMPLVELFLAIGQSKAGRGECDRGDVGSGLSLRSIDRSREIEVPARRDVGSRPLPECEALLAIGRFQTDLCGQAPTAHDRAIEILDVLGGQIRW